jgi:hypothetical protein
MTQPQDGGPAFPPTFGMSGEIGEGMSLRDWFAGRALAQVIGNLTSNHGDWSYQEVATCAYDQADAMIAERNKP